MTKFKKASYRIIAYTISMVFLSNTMLYPCPLEKTLRVPSSFQDSKWKKRIEPKSQSVYGSVLLERVQGDGIVGEVISVVPIQSGLRKRTSEAVKRLKDNLVQRIVHKDVILASHKEKEEIFRQLLAALKIVFQAKQEERLLEANEIHYIRKVFGRGIKSSCSRTRWPVNPNVFQGPLLAESGLSFS